MPNPRRPLARRLRLPSSIGLVLAILLVLPAVASAQVFVVDNLGDESSPYGCEVLGECSLREAIERSNGLEGEDTIEFEVEGTIEPGVEPLPMITDPVSINATTLPNYKGAPLVAIDGSHVFTEGATEGLFFGSGSGGSLVEGLAIGEFDIGVRFAPGSGSQLCASYVGVGLDGATAFPNGVGVETEGVGDRVGTGCFAHGGNIISGNESYGVVDFGEGSEIAQNVIGLDATEAALPNGPFGGAGAGVLVNASAKHPRIRGFVGEGIEPGNVIADNRGAGILIEDGSVNATIRRNSIHGNSHAAIEILAGPKTPAPLIEFSKVEAETSEVLGTIQGEPEEEYFVEVFASAGCYPGGAGEAEVLLGGIWVTTDSTGLGIISTNQLAEPPFGAEYFTATATAEATGATSVVSLCQDQPPETEIASSPGDPSSSSDASFEFTGSDLSGSVAGFECSLDGAPFSECSSPQDYPGLADGSHTFEVRAFDQVFTSDPTPASYSWNVDTEFPAIVLESTPANPTSQSFASFDFSATDSGSGIANTECRFDSAELSACTSPASIDSLADGSHTFEVRATDNAGHTAAESFTWTVDATAPTTTIDTEPPNPSGSGEATFTFSAEDGGGSGVETIECSLDGETFEECSSPKSYTGLADGSHSFEVQAVDEAGNVGDPASYSWNVDTVLPAITLEATPPNPTNQTGATITFTATDPGSGIAKVECRFDTAALGACTSPASASSLADGPHVFEVQATDNAGNLNNETTSWTVDATAPTTTIETNPPDPSGSGSPSFSFSGADPGGTGVAGFECKLDAVAFSACTSPQGYSNVADGSHSFEVRTVDSAGNTDASPATYTWTVESGIPAAPQLTGTIPDSPAADETPLVEGTAPAGTTVALYETADCSGTPLTSSVTPAELEAGIETTVAPNSVTEFSATATSPAAVTSACSAPLSYREDSTAPTTAIDAKPASSSGSGTASFTFGGSDPGGSGVGGFECSLDGAAFAPCISPKEYTGLGNGSHTFEVRAVDAAGNTDAAPVDYTWSVDSASPGPTQTGGGATPSDTGPAPSNGETVAVAPGGGKVFVQRPGQKKPTELKEGETIPVGSLVDATNGKVLLTSVNAAGETQSAYFFGGKFLVTQHEGNGLVVLKLRGELSCAAGAGSSAVATASAKSGKKLWGSGHGNFKTEGSSGSATVRGTIWLTEDRCDGTTFFKVRRGVVSVRDFAKEKTISLPAGNSYLASP